MVNMGVVLREHYILLSSRFKTMIYLTLSGNLANLKITFAVLSLLKNRG